MFARTQPPEMVYSVADDFITVHLKLKQWTKAFNCAVVCVWPFRSTESEREIVRTRSHLYAQYDSIICSWRQIICSVWKMLCVGVRFGDAIYAGVHILGRKRQRDECNFMSHFSTKYENILLQGDADISPFTSEILFQTRHLRPPHIPGWARTKCFRNENEQRMPNIYPVAMITIVLPDFFYFVRIVNEMKMSNEIRIRWIGCHQTCNIIIKAKLLCKYIAVSRRLK